MIQKAAIGPHGIDQGAIIYDLGIGWRDAAVVSAGCSIAVVRRDRHQAQRIFECAFGASKAAEMRGMMDAAADVQLELPI